MERPSDETLVTLEEAAKALGSSHNTLQGVRAKSDIPLAGERPAVSGPYRTVPLFRLGDVRAALEAGQRKRRKFLYGDAKGAA